MGVYGCVSYMPQLKESNFTVSSYILMRNYTHMGGSKLTPSGKIMAFTQ